MTPIITRELRKHFGKTVAVDGVDLNIRAGDLFFLLGPSGCGKTTLLRMLAGFIDPTAGSIHFGEREVTHLPPNKRNTGMVFQGYALWPHLSVAQNVGFGLDVRKIKGAERQQRIDKALDMVQMRKLADRKPNALSGGQQQRVALARALVVEPTVLLLDEPLSNLDAKLRTEMRSQIREICKRVGITGVYVTHDQKEALSMADRIAVMRDGRVMQLGSPRDVYHRPSSRFVADFLGATNFVPGELRGMENGVAVLETPLGKLVSEVFPEDMPETGNVTCSIRPEAMHLERVNGEANGDGVEKNTFAVDRLHATYLGEVAQYDLMVNDQLQLKAYELNPRLIDLPDEKLRVRIDPADVVILRD
ncbi:ABC transporter ATP-binding protein [Phycisphaerales bacterium AB-hyl4]|uniref:ABC transporter ATP-binding protein n=1 Tax=Natronomicrosphaera hydrolytica TaxID=3242702 RepID=A0ABV4U3K1_9BACT